MQGLHRAIEIAGGVPELTRRCGYRYESRIRNWLARGRVPSDQIPVVQAAVGYEVSADQFLPAPIASSNHPT